MEIPIVLIVSLKYIFCDIYAGINTYFYNNNFYNPSCKRYNNYFAVSSNHSIEYRYKRTKCYSKNGG